MVKVLSKMIGFAQSHRWSVGRLLVGMVVKADPRVFATSTKERCSFKPGSEQEHMH
jgi:hypothetical protein